MLEKRISRQLVEDSVTYFYLMSRIVAYSVVGREHNPHWKKLVDQKLSNLNHSFTENAFKVLFGRVPGTPELVEFQALLGLTITNGPGTLSAKGAKGSVSARNDISMAFVGFLANTGRAHGGNGYEAIEFLVEQFKGVTLPDPGDPAHGLDLKRMANEAARTYGSYKKQALEAEDGPVRPIPCINHPIFRGNHINVDPREQFVAGAMAEKGVYNAFWEFYRLLVQELYNEGATKNVFCVNVDAVLAVITLKLVWKDLQAGRITLRQVQELAFTLFLFGRTLGVSAEIADHRDRGMDMDCRTPEKDLTYVL
jgi:citrate synthase